MWTMLTFGYVASIPQEQIPRIKATALCPHSVDNAAVNSAISFVLQIDSLYSYPYWMTEF